MAVVPKGSSGGLKQLFYDAWHPPAVPKTSFGGRTALLTGSNSGIGYEAALRVHALGASRVILAVRDGSSGETAKQKILGSNKTAQGSVDVWQLDMASYESISAFVKRVEVELPRLDIVLLNAGIWKTKYGISKYQWEQTLQVNCLSTVLLAILLAPKLRASKTAAFTPVLEFTSSGLHRFVGFDADVDASSRPLSAYNDKCKGSYKGQQTYATSKFFLMAALPHFVALSKSPGAQQDTGKAVRQLDSAYDFYVTTACPGFTYTALARDVQAWWNLPLFYIMKSILMRTAEQGARTLVSGLGLGEKGVGQFWQHDTLQAVSTLLEGEAGKERSDRIWNDIIASLKRDVADIEDYLHK